MLAGMLVITKSDHYLRQRQHFSSILQSCDCVWQCESVFVTSSHICGLNTATLEHKVWENCTHSRGRGHIAHTPDRAVTSGHHTRAVQPPTYRVLRFRAHLSVWAAWAGRIFTTVFAPQQMTKTEISIIDSIKTFEISSKIIKYPDLAFSPADKSHFTHLTLRPPWPY